MKNVVVLLGLGVSLWSVQASAVKVFEDKDNGASINVGALIQPWLQLTTPAGSSGSGACGSAGRPNCSAGIGNPDGGPSLDFFVRRVRLMAYGSVTKEISYFIDTDEPNLGKAGNFTLNTIVQDAFLTYTFAPEIRVDAGLMLLPFSHHTLEGATSLNALDYHAEMIRFPVSLAFRDVGVQLRGLVGSERVHYRIGAFEGVRAAAVPALPPPAAGAPPPPVRQTLNNNGLPRLTAQVRVNVVGSEPDFFFKGIYFSPTPIVSIGVGADYQHHAVYSDTVNGLRRSYGALSGDVFAELPLTPDDEVIAKANVFYYGKGNSTIPSGTALIDGGVATYAEAGFRHAWVEPLAFIEYLKERNSTLTVVAPHAGVNVWINKHTFNLKSDFGFRRAERKGEATQKDILWTTQAQVFF